MLNRVFNTWGKIYTKNLWSGLSGPDPLVDSDADPKERPIERRDRDRRVICQCGYHVTGSAEQDGKATDSQRIFKLFSEIQPKSRDKIPEVKHQKTDQ